MNDLDPMDTVPATPEYVLSVLREWHRRAVGYESEVDADSDLSAESTVDFWLDESDFSGWNDVGRWQNDVWKIRCTDEEWRAVLKPARKRTVGGVCDLIARHATRRKLRPARLLGRECLPAGAFLAVRTLLSEAGADVEDLAPSTPLAEWTRRHLNVFLWPIANLAPGALPPVRVRYPLQSVGCLATGLGLVLAFLGLLCPMPSIATLGGFLAASAFLMIFGFSLATGGRPESVTFGELRTFRDLAVAIARASRTEPA